MGYYIEVRPRDTTPISLEAYKERFAKWMERHPAATHPEEDPQIRKSFANAFMHRGGILDVFKCRVVPAGVSAWARFSWGDDADSFRESFRALAVVANRVSADLYIGETRIESGDEEKVVEDYKKATRTVLSVLGAVSSGREMSDLESAAVRSVHPMIDKDISTKLSLPISELFLSVRSLHCLNTANIRTVGELVAYTEKNLMAVRNFGKPSLADVKRALNELGLSLGMKDKEISARDISSGKEE